MLKSITSNPTETKAFQLALPRHWNLQTMQLLPRTDLLHIFVSYGFNDLVLVSGFDVVGVMCFLEIGFSILSAATICASETGRDNTINKVPVLYFIPPLTLS